jgi:hypothetical protein
MDALSLANALQFDDSSIALLALIVGMIGGYQITGWHTKHMKAKRAKVAAQRPRGFARKVD